VRRWPNDLLVNDRGSPVSSSIRFAAVVGLVNVQNHREPVTQNSRQTPDLPILSSPPSLDD
jgi:hypothetical protein